MLLTNITYSLHQLDNSSSQLSQKQQSIQSLCLDQVLKSISYSLTIVNSIKSIYINRSLILDLDLYIDSVKLFFIIYKTTINNVNNKMINKTNIITTNNITTTITKNKKTKKIKQTKINKNNPLPARLVLADWKLYPVGKKVRINYD